MAIDPAQDNLVVGVIDKPLDLDLRQPEVDRVKNRAEGRHSEVELKMSLGVPEQRRNPIALGNPRPREGARQPR